MTRMADKAQSGGRSGASARSAAAGLRDGAQLGSQVVDTFGDLVYERTEGRMREGMSVLLYVALWGAFMDRVGREPSSDLELSKTMRFPYRTLNRHSHAFRAAFPEYATPSILWATRLAQHPHSSHPEVMVTQLGAAPL